MNPGDVTARLDGIVADARASRDAAGNRLDAVQRESERATARLAAQVGDYLRAAHAAASAIDEHDGTVRDTTPPAPRTDDDEPEQTWLR